MLHRCILALEIARMILSIATVVNLWLFASIPSLTLSSMQLKAHCMKPKDVYGMKPKIVIPLRLYAST